MYYFRVPTTARGSVQRLFQWRRRGIVALGGRDRGSSIPDAILPYFERWGSGGRGSRSPFGLGAEAAYGVPGLQCCCGRDVKEAASHVVFNEMAEANERPEVGSGKQSIGTLFASS